jgi:uncharacterized membrane protein
MLLVFAVLFIPDSPLRIVIGIPFVLFFPGYALIGALFPKKTDLGGIERLTLSIGLSLALAPLIGLALNYTPWGIRLYPIITSLFATTLLLSIVSNYRRAKLPSDLKFHTLNNLKMPDLKAIPRTDKVLVTAVLIAIIAVASITVYVASAPKIGEPFTEFYLLGPDGKLADYPVNLTLSKNRIVILGITNHEYAPVVYRIDILFDNQTIETITNIQLEHQESWSQNYTFVPHAASDRAKLVFQLFKADSQQPYRNLHLWITIESE